MNQAHRPSGQDTAETDLRRSEALRLRTIGLTYQQIADQLSVTQRAATMLVREAAAGLRDESAAVYRQVANERYNLTISRMLAVMLDARQPDGTGRTDEVRIQAARVVSQTTERQARMNGACAPDLIVVLSPDEQHAADEARAERLLADLNAYLAGVADATAGSEAPEA